MSTATRNAELTNYSVKTTGMFCRPSCAAHLARPEQIGMPKAVRAVARACGANALAVAIPCHRVIRNDGGLSGYRWGVERKRTLLDREAQV
ncbi:MAG TPA: methylated-DNA--[protein]-cysteine S-methyltransferase [Silvibacterium sp.]|nr:methylated-DNA--[protein]-cysteine S-methyltransferase [Silvibacterium sp.]